MNEATDKSSAYRAGLPPVPWRLRHRPVERGYPVPWFAAQVQGVWDFRVVDGNKLTQAITERRCWVCGVKLGGYLAFPIGPMCTINRTISEPPSHRECAEWSIQACPFLTQQESRRRTAGLPEEATEPAGVGILRQPGVVCLWITKSYRAIRVENGILFKIGAPIVVKWFREGRAATRGEVMESIDSGYPILLQAAQAEGSQAMRDLETARERAMGLLPKEAEEQTV